MSLQETKMTHRRNYSHFIEYMTSTPILDMILNHKEDAVFLTASTSVLDVFACHGEYALRVKQSKLLESIRVVLQ